MENEQELNNIENTNIELQTTINESIPEEPSVENSTSHQEENNTSNCLALTIKKDYKLTSVVNVAIRSLRMSFKVFVSYVTLNIIKLFF